MRVYARKARLVLSSTFVEFVFFFFEFLFEFMLLSKFVLLLPTQIPPPNSLSKLLIQRKSLFKKISDLKNLAIQESTHFQFVILVVILSTAKIDFLINFSLSWLFRIASNHLSQYYNVIMSFSTLL